MKSDGGGRVKFTSSVQFKFILLFSLLIAILLILMNTIPVVSSRDLVFAEKESSLSAQASVVSSSLSALDSLSSPTVAQVMGLLEVSGVDRVVVTDGDGRIVYDTLYPRSLGKTAGLPEVEQALSGQQAFRSRYAGGAFDSCAAMPVMSGSKLLGAVYVSEYDTQQAELIGSIQSRLGTASIVACVFGAALTVVFTRALTARITKLRRAIGVVRGGDYEHRVEISGHDELSELGEEFNTLTERLQETERERRRFVSDASHELKTPLAAIRLLADSITQSGGMDEETMREFVSDIGSEAERLQHTTEKLLDLSRRDDGVLPERTASDMGEVALATSRLLSPLAEQMDVTVSCSAEENCTVLASEDELYQIIYNLTENAIKYNVEGGRVDVRVSRREESVVLEVEDTGIGIPPEDLPNIFRRFYRVDKARSRERGGSGLGLSIVHDCVLSLGGSIEATAQEEQGTRFTVVLPKYGG